MTPERVAGMKPRAILFDLDETLILEEESNHASARLVCDAARERCGADGDALFRAIYDRCLPLWMAGPAIEYCRAIGISSREGLWGSFEGDGGGLRVLREWTPGYRLASWTGALSDVGVSDQALALTLAELFMRDRAERHVLFPETERVMRALMGRFKLGLMTNGAPDVQRVKIAGSKLARYFDIVLVSGEIGIGKPAARIFELALNRLGVAARDALMIGDSLNRDVGGAKNAGIASIWLNRFDTTRKPHHPVPDFEVRDLSALLELLGIAQD